MGETPGFNPAEQDFFEKGENLAAEAQAKAEEGNAEFRRELAAKRAKELMEDVDRPEQEQIRPAA